MSKEKDDEILGKAYDSQLMKRLLGFVKPYKKYAETQEYKCKIK